MGLWFEVPWSSMLPACSLFICFVWKPNFLQFILLFSILKSRHSVSQNSENFSRIYEIFLLLIPLYLVIFSNSCFYYIYFSNREFVLFIHLAKCKGKKRKPGCIQFASNGADMDIFIFTCVYFVVVIPISLTNSLGSVGILLYIKKIYLLNPPVSFYRTLRFKTPLHFKP